AAQAVLDFLRDPAPRVALLVRVLAHRSVDLGGEDDLLPLVVPLERLADDLLGRALAVDVGGVDEVDAGVESGVDHADAVVDVAVAPWPEHHRPEAVRTDLDTSAAQRAVLHRYLQL